MNLIDSAHFIGYKLTKPQTNLLLKLQELGVEASDFDEVLVTNPISGYSQKDVNPLIAALIQWTYVVYSSYDWNNPMTFNGQKVSIQTYDRVRMLVLALDSKAYSNFLD